MPNTLNSADGIVELVVADPWMMDILQCAQTLDLPDWWVCAGFVRSKVWDTLHGYAPRTHRREKLADPLAEAYR